jgi:hypothetical protein
MHETARRTPAEQLRRLFETPRAGDYAGTLIPGADLDLAADGGFLGYEWHWLDVVDGGEPGRYLAYRSSRIVGVEPHDRTGMLAQLSSLVRTARNRA